MNQLTEQSIQKFLTTALPLRTSIKDKDVLAAKLVKMALQLPGVSPARMQQALTVLTDAIADVQQTTPKTTAATRRRTNR